MRARLPQVKQVLANRQVQLRYLEALTRKIQLQYLLRVMQLPAQ